jgi:hypothetical protein
MASTVRHAAVALRTPRFRGPKQSRISVGAALTVSGAVRVLMQGAGALAGWSPWRAGRRTYFGGWLA